VVGRPYICGITGTITTMDRRVLPALSTALATVCAEAANFGDTPHAAQLAFLLATALFAAAFYVLDLKKATDVHSCPLGTNRRIAVVPILKNLFDVVTLPG
jgi:hypothetical protein